MKSALENFAPSARVLIPRADINPNTLTLLKNLGHDVSSLRPKSWDEFALPGGPNFDFIFTVCDNAAGEACPIWLGHPVTAHWGVPDPAEAKGTPAEIAQAFNEGLSDVAPAHRTFRLAAFSRARRVQSASEVKRDRPDDRH